MSELRKQFEQAKADYESARYPGDLAADLRLDRASRSQWYWRVGVPVGIAAGVLLAFTVLWPGKTPVMLPNETIAIVPPATDPTPSATYDTPAVAAMPEAESMPESPSFPNDMPSIPSMPSMSSESLTSFPSMPSMPAWDSPSTTSTTEKEPA